MEQKTNKKIIIFLPWILIISVLVISTLFGLAYRAGSNLFEAKLTKVDLLSTMMIHLLEADEAEKNAVLAITDETSEVFAARARQAADAVENSRKEIESIIHQSNIPQEIEMINEFNSCWSEYRVLNETVLKLATQNTNLKAQKISATQCAEEIRRFDLSLHRIIRQNTQSNQCNNAVLLSYEALTASLKIFALHKPHIEEANDQEMDKVELSIKSYDELVRKALSDLHGVANLSGNEDLNNAETAYQGFMNLTAEVLRLSRMNTNIKSSELSLGKNRIIASQCHEILNTLKDEVQTLPDKATR